MGEATTSERLRIGGCLLDPQRGVLTSAEGVATTLRPKTLDLMQLLRQRPGQVISRAEILDALWPGVFVTDDSVTQCVGELRRAMGAEGATLLRTVPRRGYLLDAGVPAEALPARPDLPVVVAQRPIAIAATALAVMVAVIGWLAWPSPPPPQAAPPAVLAARPVLDPDAAPAPTPAELSMQLVAQGRAVLRSSGRLVETRLEARRLFERAIELDPQNFRALSEAAFTYTNAVLGGASLSPAADLARAEALTERAIAIESRHATTHTARAAVLRLQRRHEEALVHYRMAVELDPSGHASRANMGFMMLLVGRGEDAEGPIRASLAGGPSPQFLGAWHAYLGLIQLHIGAGDHGVAELRASLDHEAFLSREERLVYLVAALQANGQPDAAAALAAEIVRAHPEQGLAWFANRALSDHPIYRAQFAVILEALRRAGLPA